MKRQHLLLEALSLSDKKLKLVIAGPPDSPADAEQLKQTVERLGLSERVKLDLRFLPRATYAKYVNDSCAVAYLPFDEDSLGYVTMEAAIAGKALITTTDSGGVLGLVKNKVTGWVAEPTPAALAEAIAEVGRNFGATRQYGLAAKELWHSFNIDWPSTVEKLLR
jgi:glycosyltransferase involved in cell wall biosynthesis